MICPKCGAENNDGVKFCKKCGSKFAEEPTAAENVLSESTDLENDNAVNGQYSENAVESNTDEFGNVESFDESGVYQNSGRNSYHDGFSDDNSASPYDYDMNEGNFQYDEPHSSRRWIIIIVSVAVALLAAGIAVYFIFFANQDNGTILLPEETTSASVEPTTEPTTVKESETTVPTTAAPTTEPTTVREVTVPDVVGLRSSDATKKLRDSGLEIDIILVPDKIVQSDYVVSQSPVAGRTANENDTITVYVSKGSGSNSSSNNSSSRAESSTTSRKPEFSKLEVSSTLPPIGNDRYDSTNLLHNDNTCWCEGVSGTGAGEYILFSDSKVQTVKGVSIVNGYSKSKLAFDENGRVTEMKFEFSDGTSFTKGISDTIDLQNISFGRSINTTYIKMTIVSACEGSVYDDTCISFIAPY